MACECSELGHQCKLVVLTGGPGAGKTAVLEVVRKHFCHHVAVLPESASILFGGGFPRRDSASAHRAGQRAIFHVQHELERMAIEDGSVAVALCDRGTLDGLAYVSDKLSTFWDEVGSTREAELERYAAVIHLRTPNDAQGYNHANPVRIESATEALALDTLVLNAWEGHPHRTIVESSNDFLEKLTHVIALIRAEVPPCCRAHAVTEIGEPEGDKHECD